MRAREQNREHRARGLALKSGLDVHVKVIIMSSLKNYVESWMIVVEALNKILIIKNNLLTNQ